MEGGHGHNQAGTPERLRSLPSRLLNLAAGYAQRQAGERLATLDSRKWHYAVLAALEEFGPDSQSGLSDRTGIYRSDLVATINDLTARGFVVRAHDPADRRRNAITLTEEGRRHLKRLDVLLADAEAEFLAPLSKADRTELIRLLKVIVAHHSSPERSKPLSRTEACSARPQTALGSPWRPQCRRLASLTRPAYRARERQGALAPSRAGSRPDQRRPPPKNLVPASRVTMGLVNRNTTPTSMRVVRPRV